MPLGGGNTLGLFFRIGMQGTEQTKKEISDLRSQFNKEVADIKKGGTDAFLSLGNSAGLSVESMAGIAVAAAGAITAIAAIGAAVTAAGVAIFALAKQTAEFNAHLFDLSQKTHFSVETLSA